MGALFSFCFNVQDEDIHVNTTTATDAQAPLLSSPYLQQVVDVKNGTASTLSASDDKKGKSVKGEIVSVGEKSKKDERHVVPRIKVEEEEVQDENSNQHLLNSNKGQVASGIGGGKGSSKGERRFFNKNIPNSGGKASNSGGDVVAPSYIMEEYSLDNFKHTLIKGFEIKKYSRKGTAKLLHVWSNLDHSYLLWKSNKSKAKPLLSPGFDPSTNLYHFDLTKVTDVVKGVGAFRSSKPSSADKCFSLMSASRSLDIQCNSIEEAAYLYKGFTDLLNIVVEEEKTNN